MCKKQLGTGRGPHWPSWMDISSYHNPGYTLMHLMDVITGLETRYNVRLSSTSKSKTFINLDWCRSSWRKIKADQIDTPSFRIFGATIQSYLWKHLPGQIRFTDWPFQARNPYPPCPLGIISQGKSEGTFQQKVPQHETKNKKWWL